ncbi:hypothetical protein CR513_43774, partial [Mucuna pruriens]
MGRLVPPTLVAPLLKGVKLNILLPWSRGGFPYKIVFREAKESGSEEGAFEGVPSWIDLGVVTTHSSFKHLNKLVEMVDAICRRGPWSVKVLPYHSDEFVCKWADSEESFFYFYETLFSKLDIMLPFIKFEQAVLSSLNIASTQLHTNIWAFVRAFELLSEDLG